MISKFCRIENYSSVSVAVIFIITTTFMLGCIQAPASNKEAQKTETPAPTLPKKTEVEVPDVVGVKESQAREVIEAMKLETDVRTSHSATVPAGQVISQSPKKETSVREGTTVVVRVSTGPEPGTAPASPSAQASSEPRSNTRIVYVPPTPETRVVERPSRPPYSVERLSESDLYGKTRWELDVMRNVPYARHGYRFKRSDLRGYFGGVSWYDPDTSSMSVVERRLSSAERNNVRLIQDYQKRTGMIP